MHEYRINPVAYIDNDSLKKGMISNGIPIIIFNDWIAKRNGNEYVLIASEKYSSDIKKQLIKEGILRRKIIDYTEVIDDLADEIYEKHKNDFSVDNDIFNYSGIPCIVYDGSIFESQKRGGISRYYYELTKEISKKKEFNLKILSAFHINELEFNSITNSHFLFYGKLIKKEFLCKSKLLRERVNNKFYNELEKTTLCDIYHPTYYNNNTCCKYKHMVLTVYDMIHELFNLDKETIINKKKLIDKADAIIAISENTKKDIIEKYGISEERIKVIYLANSLNIEVKNERIIKEEYLLYVGSRASYKNSDSLLEAFAFSKYKKQLKLVLFGGGPLKDKEKEKIKELRIENSVIWLEGNDEILANLYNYAEIFIYPSKYEGFGIPILEAMYYGTPIITSNVSSIPEVGGDAVEYFDPYSSEDLCNKIDYLLGDSARRKELSRLGIERERHFSWEKTASETMDVYRKLIEQR